MTTEHLADDLEEAGRTYSSPQLIGMAERVRRMMAELEAARKGQGRWVG